MDLYIADDSALFRKLLVQLAAKHGYTPRAFVDGNELWNCLASLPQDTQFLTLIDWEMPGYEGPELCRKIRERFRRYPPYVILLTARDGIDDVLGGLRAGANDYVTKPFRDEDLLARLEVARHTLTMQGRLKEATEQLAQAEKMVSIGQLAAGAAHEVNNPIGFVKSNLESLRGYFRDLLDVVGLIEQGDAEHEIILARLREIDIDFIRDDIQDLFSETHLGIARVQQVISSLEQFAHERPADLQPISLLRVVPTVLHADRGYTVELDGLPEVNGDEAQLQRLFSSLIDNAVWATEERGQIRIVGRTVDACVEVDVIDTGRGIPDALLSKIFDPFYTSRPIGEGTGLGLTSAFNIVRRHAGSIRVKSREGKGTIFTVVLPKSRLG